MALNVPVFYQRTVTAVVFVAIMLAGLFWNEWSFLVLILFINTMCIREFLKLSKKMEPDARWPALLPVCMEVFALAILLLLHFWLYRSPGTPKIISGVFLLCIVPPVLLTVSILSPKTFFAAMSQSLTALAYITLPMAGLMYMRHVDMMLPVMLIVMIWTNDTMAYLVGSFFGRTPFSSISPKKTWEGTLGGMLLTIGGAVACSLWLHQFAMVDWVALSLFAAVCGTAGDLLESKLKRMADVKDSGTIMPGHGGALDRFDSLLLAAPFAAVYVYFFR